MKQRVPNLYIQILRWGIGGILVIAPFYAALSIWLASGLHHLDFFKIWKEVALAILGLILLGFVFTHKQYAKLIWRKKLLLLIVAYTALLLIDGFYVIFRSEVSEKAVIYGWLIDIRPVAIFAVALLTFTISRQTNWPPFPWKKLLLIPALIAITFGFLQMTVLPKDILRHIGYGPSTTLSYQTVDNQPNLVRVQSTLRGPDPFGAYIGIIQVALVALFIEDKAPKKRLAWGAFFLLSLIVLYGTYSRGAELGLLASLVVLLAIEKRRAFRKHLLVVVGVGVIVLAAGIFAAARGNYLAQNLLFHSSNRSTSAQSSNAQRVQAYKNAVKDIAHHPLGSGVGSAGPASRRNSKGPVKIAENYFLQIGQEVGLLGMAMFIAISIMVAFELWQRRQATLAKILLSSLAGITIINMVMHGWADDTLAYVWWGLAGLACAPAILKANKSSNEKTQQKPS